MELVQLLLVPSIKDPRLASVKKASKNNGLYLPVKGSIIADDTAKILEVVHCLTLSALDGNVGRMGNRYRWRLI